MTPAPAVPAHRAVAFRAMACDVRLELLEAGPGTDSALDSAREIFARVHRTCTRFDPASPLMRANAAGPRWSRVPAECYEALREAADAHELTGGLFDPRVLEALTRLGYDRTLPFRDGPVSLPDLLELSDLPDPAGNGTARSGPQSRGRWRPEFDEQRLAVRVGPEPVDLGGIGKGLAIRWAAAEIAAAQETPRLLVEAGGDCFVAGDGPDAEHWRVGVEDPSAPVDVPAPPIAVLALRDTGCATSSVRVRSWRRGEVELHHLIDPRTGTSATPDPLAVTVVHPDPALAEVWSKALLVAGARRASALAEEHDLAALWVRPGGGIELTPAMAPLVIWPAAA